MGRLQTGRLENLIRRWGSIKGGGSVLSETLGDVFPILDLEKLPPELLLLAGIHTWSGVLADTGAAGQNAGIQVVNRANSGIIMVVTRLSIRSSTAQSVTYGTVNGLLTGSSIGLRNRDTRDGLLISQWGSLQSDDTSNTEFFGNIRLAINVDRVLEVPNGIAVLSPGNQFTVSTTTNATFMSVGFQGYSRLAEPSELSF